MEGWQFGDIINMDMPAAKAALENGELEIVDERESVRPMPKPELPFSCDICGQVCKSKLGLNAHKRKHKGGVK